MFKKALFHTDNCVEIAQLFFEEMTIRVSKGTIKKELAEHPDYPSLLSISDVLSNYGVQSLAFKIDISRFSELPVPFITVIKDDEDYTDLFAVVRSVNDNVITYYNSKAGKWTTADCNQFKSIWSSEVVLIADKENVIEEKDYSKNRWKDHRNAIGTVATFFSLPVLVIAHSLSLLLNVCAQAVFPILFTLFTLAGAIVCCLLLWYEVDKYNPILQQICTAGKKVNCSAILTSKGSTIFGISWSVIGFVYFTGSVLLLLFDNILNRSTQTFLAWVNIIVLPYTIFSIVYQWRIVKQWCLLCLMVQFVLVSQFVIAFFAGWHVTLTFNDIPNISIIISYLLPFLIVNLLLPNLKLAKNSKQNKLALQKLKHVPSVFNALLLQQKAIHESTEGLGIVLGAPNAKHKIVKVCNPYCGPCAQSHKPLEDLLANNDNIQLQIIFLATNHKDDMISWPAKHLLAIAQKNDQAYMLQALDDWYMVEEKNYTTFSEKYPLNGELRLQEEKIDAMAAWCIKMEVFFTPTFFVNGHKLPPEYNATDLKYFLSV